MKHCYFENRDCDYYPCHDAEHINCMFCFCPLYPKEDCGGDFVMKDGAKKDCSSCLRPHGKDGYDYVIQKLK